MSRSTFLAALAALYVSTAVALHTAPTMDREWVAAICEGDGLPFALPSAAATEEWTDTEHEGWADVQWSSYCARPVTREAKAVCACTGH